GVKLMFFNQNARGQTFNCVALVNRHHTLRNDRSAIERLINKMNRAAGFFGALLERLPLRVEARKRRQQTRMNVQNATAIAVEKLARQHAHVASQTNQIDFAGLQSGDDFAIVFCAGTSAAFNHEGFDSALLSFTEAGSVWLIADNGRVLSI